MIASLIRRLMLATVLAQGLVGAASAAQDLTLEVYNPGDQAIFAVSSVLVSGAREAILIDAQFGKSQAEQVVQKIRASGKTLSTIYISHGDPDFYFGLDTIKAAFPAARVLASPQTVAHIKATAPGKLAHWGPILGADAPDALIVPEALQGHTLTLEGRQLEVLGLDGPQPQRSFVWIPSLKAVVGGVVLFNNQHVWMADTQSVQSHADWLTTLARIEALQPRTVVPGHFMPGPSRPLQAAAYTAGYIRAFEAASAQAVDAAALSAAMKKLYPQAVSTAGLEISAKVAKGEMTW